MQALTVLAIQVKLLYRFSRFSEDKKNERKNIELSYPLVSKGDNEQTNLKEEDLSAMTAFDISTKTNYTKIPNAIIESTKLSAYDKIVLITLCRFDPCFPSYRKLMKLTGLSMGQIWKSLKKLKEKCLVTPYKIGKQKQGYIITFRENKIVKPLHTVNGTASYSERFVPKTVHREEHNKIKKENNTNLISTEARQKVDEIGAEFSTLSETGNGTENLGRIKTLIGKIIMPMPKKSH
jgi:hypothetical protein